MGSTVLGSILASGKRHFSSPERPNGLIGPHIAMFSWYRKSFTEDKATGK